MNEQDVKQLAPGTIYRGEVVTEPWDKPLENRIYCPVMIVEPRRDTYKDWLDVEWVSYYALIFEVPTPSCRVVFIRVPTPRP